MVRPWKAPSAATMPVRPVRRLSLMAASITSAPELAKNTADPSGAPAMAISRSASEIWASEVKRLEMWMASAACLDTALTSAGWPWPSALTAIPPTRSR